MSQTCPRCEKTKPHSQFFSDRPACKRCLADERMRWHYRNREKSKKISSDWKKRNAATQFAYNKEYRERHKEKSRRALAEWCAKNKEKRKAYSQEYRRLNRAKVYSWLAKRRGTKLRAVPAWANQEKIKDIYSCAIKKTKDTGIKYVVDHIVPLQSKIVCGLHCEDNLRVITFADNASKKNYWWPDMPGAR